MTKQEFMAMSLPYKLCVISKLGNSIGNLTAVDAESMFIFRTVRVGGREKDMKHIDSTLPILHPLADLKKEIVHKGEAFVPKNKLQEIYPAEMIGLNLATWSFRVVLTLIEWHFDISGLIENGEAIDVNTLTDNPYK